MAPTRPDRSGRCRARARWPGATSPTTEILAVVCHERYTLGGADPTSDDYVEEFENWCSEEAPAFLALESGATLEGLAELGLTDAEGEEIPIIDIGDAPVAGSPPGG